jgi:hypothetical protein
VAKIGRFSFLSKCFGKKFCRQRNPTGLFVY